MAGGWLGEWLVIRMRTRFLLANEGWLGTLTSAFGWRIDAAVTSRTGKPPVVFMDRTSFIRSTGRRWRADWIGRWMVLGLAARILGAAESDAEAAGDGVRGDSSRKTHAVDGTQSLEGLQGARYFPSVLDVRELGLGQATAGELRASIAAYQRGNVLAAQRLFPVGYSPLSAEESVYHAALLLAAGDVERAEVELAAAKPEAGETDAVVQRVVEALSGWIALVRDPVLAGSLEPRFEPLLATEWLVESHRLQMWFRLQEALQAARFAAAAAPDSGLAWARVAELEFGLGERRSAGQALEAALGLAPELAPAVSLRGFLLVAGNHGNDAIGLFEQALALNPLLAEAWLGRGLCRMRQGHFLAGLEDLRVAAKLDPRRSSLRAYLGKGLAVVGQLEGAQEEWRLAAELDPRDPTSFLYAALGWSRQNEPNRAMDALEESQERNHGRQPFRSRFFLNPDRAVGGDNLAELYRDAGLEETGVREAIRAVQAGYADGSAHRFLADSYRALGDGRRVELRGGVPGASEHLLATLLSPVGAGSLSPIVSQFEPARWFEQDRTGFVTETRYSDNGDWRENAVAYGVIDGTSYALEMRYRHENGERRNEDLEMLGGTLRLQQQLGADDGVYLKVEGYRSEYGDLVPYYDPASASAGFRAREIEQPGLLLGWHHEWSPGQHTLLLAGYRKARLEALNPEQTPWFLGPSAATNVFWVGFDQQYENRFDLWRAEAQQIWEGDSTLLIVGARFASGTTTADNDYGAVVSGSDPFIEAISGYYLPAEQVVEATLGQVSAYAYGQWEMTSTLRLLAGMSYDWLRYPANYRYAPLAEGEETQDDLSPKMGFFWEPDVNTTLRGAYTRTLEGLGVDHSLQLEPTGFAGFSQAPGARFLAATNSIEGTRWETMGGSIDRRFAKRTYLGMTAEWRRAEAKRQVGGMGVASDSFFAPVPLQAEQEVNFDDTSLRFDLTQLLGDGWSMGCRYRLSWSRLERRYTDVNSTTTLPAAFLSPVEEESLLHEIRLRTMYQHRRGLFGQIEASGFFEENEGYTPDGSSEQVWQLHAEVGCRFRRRQGEVGIGVVNLTDQDYRLSPLGTGERISRQRAFYVQVRLAL